MMQLIIIMTIINNSYYQFVYITKTVSLHNATQWQLK